MTPDQSSLLPPLGSRGLKRILNLGKQPLANNLVSPAALGTPDELYPLELMWDDELRLVQLSVSVPPERLFSEYLYLTSFSPTLVEAARFHVEAQVKRHGLGPGDLAMEIGSNDGYLLQHYQRAGLDVLGIDPARNVAQEAERRGVPTRCAFFSLALAKSLRAEGLRPRIVHANNVMAHIPDVHGVMAGIAVLLHENGVFVVETPYVRRMIEHLEFDTIYHEHLFYYSLTSYNGLLERNGLTVVDVEEIEAHGGSLRITAARAGAFDRSAAASGMLAEEQSLGMERSEYYEGFGREVPELIRRLRTILESIVGRGETIAGYGAAAKATVVLNSLGETGGKLQWIADRSTVKQGRFIPGVRLEVVPVERIFADRPDYLMVFAWNYIDEIAHQLEPYLASGGKLIVPFPEPRIWS